MMGRIFTKITPGGEDLMDNTSLDVNTTQGNMP